MPKTSKSGDAKKSELPDTLRRSDEKAQRTFAKAYDSAMDEYNDEERDHRVAYDALKHTHEKAGERAQAKKDSFGPYDVKSDGEQDTDQHTAGSVDENTSNDDLYEQ